MDPSGPASSTARSGTPRTSKNRSSAACSPTASPGHSIARSPGRSDAEGPAGRGSTGRPLSVPGLDRELPVVTSQALGVDEVAAGHPLGRTVERVADIIGDSVRAAVDPELEHL